MAARLETFTVYAAGTVQGVVLITIPAASTILTDPAQYGLSSTQYATLFVPQVIAAVTASLLGAWLTRRFGTKPLYMVGLAGNLAAMTLLLASAAAMADRPVAYTLLLLATASLGAGFGLTVPALNSLAAELRPGAVDASVLVLNALLGLGTALAPVLVAVFVGLGFWWGLPVTSVILLVALVAISLRLPMRTEAQAPAAAAGLPRKFWVYAAFITLYGICETVNGNWAQLDMTGHLGATAAQASLALAVFWAMVTIGRVGFAALQSRVLPARLIYHGLPFLLTGAFLIISALPGDRPQLGVVAFGLAGLGCSALLPLTISFAQEELTSVSSSVAGGVIAFYQLGYGIAAFGVGPLVSGGTSLPTVYAMAAVAALAMGGLSFAVAHGRPPPATLHPKPHPLVR
ncbi:MFS transporter [Nonomuraea sediminis]|uniref:MFS transporter n=1 Tax=Nonomuraea sediminis TaxID=2835864 RepID=UPI001BDDBA5D|nr:MFS transporter [Nonomuraea sediminis]